MSDCCDNESECCGGNTPAPGAFGVENTRGLDALAVDHEKGEVVLIMVEPRAWDGSELRLFQLQEKINAYLSFALDGEMLQTFPHLEGKPFRLQLDCAVPPDAMTDQLIKLAREQISFQGIGFEVRVVGEPAPGGGCGEGCGCAA